MNIRIAGVSKGALYGATKKGIVYLLLIGGSILFVIPFVWMVSTSLKTPAQLYSDHMIWIPNPITWENYLELASSVPIFHWTMNTLIIVALGLVGQLVSSSLVAFGFARIRFPGRNAMFGLVLSTMMLPFWVTVIPQYKVYMMLGWLKSMKPLIVPNFFGSAFYIFLLRQFFLTLPREVDEAAEMDGCGLLGIYWRIVLPLAKPALATVAVFSFIGNWNDFFQPLIYLGHYQIRKMTLTLGLAMLKNEYMTDQQLMMAGAVYAVTPILLIFFLAQKHFVQGIALTGRTGI